LATQGINHQYKPLGLKSFLFINMATFLITGCGGFVGSHLAEKLLQSGHNVVGLDLAYNDIWLKQSYSDKFTPIVGSILDSHVVNKLIENADIVVHLAAIASPQTYVDFPKRTIDINLNASISIIEAMRFSGKPLFFASTSEVFGRNPKVPWDETSDRVLGPTSVNRWCYSTSKAMIEHYLQACAQEGSLHFSGVRIFNCYGPRLSGRVVDRFVKSVLHHQSLVIHGDGMQTRCFTYIDDLIDAIYRLLCNACTCNKFYNIGTSVESTINDLASTICSITGNDFHNSVKYVPHAEAIGRSYEDISRRVPDCSLAKAELNWEAVTDLHAGLQRMIEYEQYAILSRTTSDFPQTSNETDE